MIKKNTAIVGMLFALLGLQGFEVVYANPFEHHDTRERAAEHRARAEEFKREAKERAERDAEQGKRPCVYSKSCSDCYTLKICKTGWKGGAPAFEAGADAYMCDTIPPVREGYGTFVDGCMELYLHKGWNVSYGVVHGHAWRTKVFNENTCILIGCHDWNKPCGTLTNVTERIVPGLNCSHTDRAAP